MIEDGSPILTKNNAGTLTFRNQADSADLTMGNAPATHDSTAHTGATANLLTALTPTFANWTTNPGTNANIVDELSASALTTAGVGAAGNNTIVYDLGSSKRRIVYANCDKSVTVNVSDSDGSYQALIGDGSAILNIGNTGVAKFRWLQIKLVGVVTVTWLKIRCYNLN